MKSFNKKTKAKYMKRLQAHYDADEIRRGFYWKDGKGCAVGCTIESKNEPHKAFEEELGIPASIAHLEDTIFEGLSNGDAKKFPLRFLEAVPVKTDLSQVIPRFLVWLMKDLEKFTKPRSDQRKALQTVRKLYERRLAGETVPDEEFRAAAYDAAAYDANADAADAATRSAARSAWAAWAANAAAYAARSAYAAARSATDDAAAWADAEYTAADAADAAAAAYAAAGDAEYAAAARDKQYKKMSNKLIEILETEVGGLSNE